MLGPLLALAVGGCVHSNPASHGTGMKPEFEPQNFHQTTAWLPRDVRRVAVLPLTAATGELLNHSTRDQLEQLLPRELNRTELFEVIQVRPEALRRWTGKSRWGVTDALPADFFALIREHLGCDAVIFAHVTAFRAYAPMAMGWKLHLVDTRQPQIWWACDVMYDAGDQSVARGATRFEREQQGSRLTAGDPATILRSPGRFGQYTLATSLETLQRHERNH
ncbi:MAG TPA: hypothetical protein VLD18_03700 [Verrucomicrobiae bacterium]|nr:hypothetical protein [Verrucomicrobiae bacterium]